MEVIVVSHKRGRTWRLHVTPGRIHSWLPLALIGALLIGSAGLAGHWLRGEGGVLPESLVADWAREAGAQRLELARAREEVEQNTRALARRIALLHAHVQRLDSAGRRLTEVAGLDSGEFDFEREPPLGGPEVGMVEDTALERVLASLDQFERQLSERERQMRVLEDLLLVSRLQRQVQPSGWPVDRGWISSAFGMRTDPFTGRRAMHTGIDFAGRAGADVLAVAAGIVTEAGPRFGYGTVVEINHGNGYVTRYGHNARVLVQAGDRVNKGQRIALIGSTGRSTGPHVHFEVLFNDKVVNPAQYIEASR
jgi:murein DD-endopeptidase MepM/ murein hydrolase activator NlpD